MKRLAPILLMLCATLTARAQEDTLTILRKDYRNDDGRTVIVNKPLLQRLHKGNVQTVKLETPHNGFKVLKPRADGLRRLSDHVGHDPALVLFSG